MTDARGRRSSRWSGARHILLPVLLAGVSGCGAGRCDVAGRVTYQGKPVVCGSVTLVGSDGLPVVTPIRSDGTYEARQVPVGAVQVAILSLDPARPLDPLKAGGRQDRPAGDADAESVPGLMPAVRYPPADRSNWTDPGVDRSKWFPLPRQYALTHTSGLTAELRRGLNAVDFDLK